MKWRSKKHLIYWFVAVLLVILLVFFFKKSSSNRVNQVDQVSSNVFLLNNIDSLLLKDPVSAEHFLNKLYQAESKTLTEEELAYYYTYKIGIHFEKNLLDSIPYFTNQAITYSSKVDNDALQTKLHYNLGKYYRYIGDYSKSLDNTLKGIATVGNDMPIRIDLYNNLGAIYFELNEFDLSLEYMQKAQLEAIAVKDAKRIAIANANVGNVYLMQGKYEAAKKNLQNSLLYFEKVKDTVSIIKSLTSISRIELLQDNFDAVFKYLEQAKSLSLHSKKHIQLGLVYQHYGNACGANKEYDKALDYYKKALELSDTQQVARDKMNALKGLSVNYNILKNYKEANESLNSFYFLKDSIHGVKVRQRIEELKWASVVDQEKFKNQLLNKEIETEKLNQSNLTKTYIIIITVILFGIILLWMLYQNNKKSLRISKLNNESLSDKIASDKRLKLIQEAHFQQELEARNKELISLNILILAKNKIFSDIESVIEKGESDLKQLLSELKAVIKSNQNQEKDWEKFKSVFEKTHPNFFETIKNQFPQLSKTEIRVCTYIKINMANTEICEMLNINQMSLNKSRYRIRKKLDLLGTEDLDDFVKSW